MIISRAGIFPKKLREMRPFAKLDNTLGSGASAPNAISFAGHLRQIQDLIDAVRENRPLAIDGHEGRKAVALVNAIYASAQAGAPVKL